MGDALIIGYQSISPEDCMKTQGPDNAYLKAIKKENFPITDNSLDRLVNSTAFSGFVFAWKLQSIDDLHRRIVVKPKSRNSSEVTREAEYVDIADIVGLAIKTNGHYKSENGDSSKEIGYECFDEFLIVEDMEERDNIAIACEIIQMQLNGISSDKKPVILITDNLDLSRRYEEIGTYLHKSKKRIPYSLFGVFGYHVHMFGFSNVSEEILEAIAKHESSKKLPSPKIQTLINAPELPQ